MRAPQGYRRWINRLRKLFGKPNGVVPTFAFDNPKMGRFRANHRKRRDALPHRRDEGK